VQLAAAEHAREHAARLTNMKRTLLHSLPAFDALMSWYPLRDAVAPFLGDRSTTLFAHAISAQTDCLICSTFFRRILIDAGEDPDHLPLSERDAALMEFGRHLATPPHEIPDTLYARVTTGMSDEQIVALVTFGSIMLATNVFNNALGVPLDEYLFAYRRDGSPATTDEGSHE
jgi:alkylhydroperoxidase family enzyme